MNVARQPGTTSPLSSAPRAGERVFAVDTRGRAVVSFIWSDHASEWQRQALADGACYATEFSAQTALRRSYGLWRVK